jgi:hypothetical protein
MAIQPGKFENTFLKSTTIQMLDDYIGKMGRLLIFQNNYIVFEIDNQTFPLFVNLSLGDFSIFGSNELWVRCEQGEATFQRIYQNPLWEFERNQ